MDPNNSYPSTGLSPKILIVIVGAILLIVIIMYVFVSQAISNRNATLQPTPVPTKNALQEDSSNLPTRTKQTEDKKKNLPPGVIAQVGKEYLYGEDLDNAVLHYGLLDNSESKTRDFLLNTMINQSVALQAGEKAGYVKLDSTIFNSPKKDPAKRFEAYEKVRIAALEQGSSVEGEYVSLLFNNDGYGPLGPEESKKRALEKIQPIYDKVIKGEFTMEQAGNQLKNDTTNAILDPLFKLHAYRTFKEGSTKQLTIDTTFDDILKKTNEGDITPLHVLKVEDSSQPQLTYIETGYVFGKVTKKITNSFTNFESWISAQRKNYEIIY